MCALKLGSLRASINLPVVAVDRASAARSRIAKLYRLLQEHFVALADQAMVSATSFLTTVIISRYSGAGQLGAYAIGISVLASAYTVQGQLISLPYSIHRHSPTLPPEDHAGGSLVSAGLLASMFALLLVTIASSLFASGASPELVAITWALAAVMPFALLRDFFRRFAFTHLQMAHALLLDAAVAAIQLSSLGWLGWTGSMSAVTATVALGGSCGIVALGCMLLSRARFSIRRNQVRATMKQSWMLGKWFLVNQIMVQVQRFCTYWLLATISGATMTGVYAACMSIVAFTNPLFYGLNNLFTQKSILAWKEGGGPTLRRRALQDMLSLAAAMGPFCLLTFWFGEPVLHFLFRGDEYLGYGHVIAILACAFLAFALGTPAGNALASMERPRTVLAVNSAGTILTILVVWRSLVGWGFTGAAYGWLLSNVIVASALWAGFLISLPRPRDDTSARRVLDDFVGAIETARYTIAYLGEGDHSQVYAAWIRDAQPDPESNRRLILKVYKPEAMLSVGMAEAQAGSLSRLHASLDGQVINGWTISVPIPLHVCKAPLALIMTAVPGKDLKSQMTADDELNPSILESLGRTVAAAMQQCWSRGQMHGDLGLQNILYDIHSRNVAFIDPGTRECCVVCMAKNSRWTLGATELGHILRDLGTDVRDFSGNSLARVRRKIFTTSALRAFIETIDLPQTKRTVLSEIFECAQAHLSEVIEASWLLRTFFRRPLTLFVARRMNEVLAELRDESNGAGPPAERTEIASYERELSHRICELHDVHCSMRGSLHNAENNSGESENDRNGSVSTRKPAA